MYYNTRRLHIPRSLPIILAAIVAFGATTFGVTRWVVDARTGALPVLDVQADRAAAAAGAMDYARVIAARRSTMVSISAGGSDAMSPVTGAGVVVDEDGIIVTAWHVVRSAQQAPITVTFDTRERVTAQLVATDRFNDLALLRVDPADVRTLSVAPLGDSDKLVAGAEILAMGDPFDHHASFSDGIVASDEHRVIDSRINGAWRIPDAIQHTAATNPGNSGGPLFNARGEVIGINQQIAGKQGTDTGVSFAVASNLVRRALRQFEAGASEITYVLLDVQAEDSPGGDGAVVQQAGAAAQRAGLLAGDVIEALEDRPVRHANELLRLGAYLEPGARVEVAVRRNGERRTLVLDTVPASFAAP